MDLNSSVDVQGTLTGNFWNAENSKLVYVGYCVLTSQPKNPMIQTPSVHLASSKSQPTPKP